MKKLFTIFTVLVMALIFPITTASANGGFTERDERDGGTPVPTQTTVLKQKEWNGKSSLKSNTCYFIDEEVTVSKNRTLPESSMIVVENSGKLIIPEGKRLNVSGALVIHTFANLEVGGSLNIKSTSVFVLGGDANILNSGKLNVYGFMQVSKGGHLNIDGKVIVSNNGAVDAFGIVNLSEQTPVFKYTQKQGDDKQLYMVNECSSYVDGDIKIVGVFDAEKEIKKDKLKYLRTFEAALYKYNGGFYFDFAIHDEFTFFAEYAHLEVSNTSYDPRGKHFTIYSWNGDFKNIENGPQSSYVSGSFYSIVLGKPDIGLFAEVDQVYSD